MGYVRNKFQQGMKTFKEWIDKKKEEKVEKFDKEFRENIEIVAKKNCFPGGCDNTVREVASLMGFSQQGLIYSGIRTIIETLRDIEKKGGKVRELLSAGEAQKLANQNKGDYLIIAAVANYEERPGTDKRDWRGGKHHIAFVVRYLENESEYNPACGGGGLIEKFFPYIFSPAAWHFSFGWREGEMEDPKTAVKYFQYSIKA